VASNPRQIFLAACVAGYESIRKIIDSEPVTQRWWVVAAARTSTSP
jgi:hypothetical protein